MIVEFVLAATSRGRPSPVACQRSCQAAGRRALAGPCLFVVVYSSWSRNVPWPGRQSSRVELQLLPQVSSNGRPADHVSLENWIVLHFKGMEIAQCHAIMVLHPAAGTYLPSTKNLESSTMYVTASVAAQQQSDRGEDKEHEPIRIIRRRQ